MASVLAAIGAGLVFGSMVTMAVLAVSAKVRDARTLPFFRCRVRSAASRRGRHGEWERRRRRVVWVGDVLLVRSGPLRLGLTLMSVGVGSDATVRRLAAGSVSGLGRRPVALRFVVHGGEELEIAVAGESTDMLIGPYLTTAMSVLPVAPRDPGG